MVAPVSKEMCKLVCAHIEDSDQPAHTRSLIRVLIGARRVAMGPRCLHTDN